MTQPRDANQAPSSDPSCPYGAPDALPVLPLRETVVFPLTIAPISIDQDRSRRLLDDATKGNRLVALVAIREGDSRPPRPQDLYAFATAAIVHDALRGPDNALRVAVQGLQRVRIVGWVQTEPYLIARVRWLPDAMEGPTPVSALIHAATMVSAGVFLIARVYPLMTADLGLAGVPVHALTIVAFIGAFTALLGACIAVGQNDIKRVLAFSTVSQLGYMMLALGVGSWVAAIFHLLTHAFFKALLFLGAGSVIHAAHHEQDMRSLGGLGKRMRVTFATFAVGMMALSGVPFVFSGYWSKEAILHAAREWDVSHLPLVMGLIAVALTAFYMMRLVAEVFLGKPRSASAEHAHENSAVITVPLVLLAICAVGLGFIGTPAWPWLQSRLSGVPIPAHSLLEGGGLIGASIFLVAVGLGTGWWLYARRLRESSSSLDPIAAAAPGVFAFLAARMKFDELYLATVGRANTALADFSSWLDRRVIGAGVSLIARMGESAGAFNKETDEEGLNTGFNAASDELRLAGRLYSKAQSGETHGYLRVIAVGFVILAIASLFGGGR